MDKMSLFSILAITIPEEILNIYFAFLVTGEKTHLYLDDKINIIRMSAAVILMGASAVIARAFITNFLIVMVLNVILYTVILKFTYKLQWYKSIINVILLVGFLVTIETVSMPIYMQVTGSSIDSMLSSDSLRFVYSLLERAIQIFVIMTLWNWNKVALNIKEYKEVRPILLAFIILLLATELIFSFLFIYNIQNITSIFRIVFILGFTCFAIINLSLFKLVSVLTNAVLKKEMNQIIDYKKDTNDFINMIYHHLEENDIESARRLCKKTLY